MSKLSELIVKISADSKEFNSGIAEVSRALGQLQRTTSQSFGNITRLGQDIQGIGVGLAAAVSAPLIALGAASIQAAGKMEQAKVAFTTMLKSTDEAQQHLNALKQFALQTPFQFTELVDASRRMQALGFSANEVVPKLRIIGDAVSALGLGAEGLNRVILALGQIRAKGVAQAEEMRQLAEAGIPAFQALAKKLGTDVAGAMKQVEARTVSAKTAIDAVMEAMAGRFGGGMEAQSKTLLGAWSNVLDAMKFALADVGAALLPIAKDIIKNTIQPMLDKTAQLARQFSELTPATQKWALSLAGIGIAGPISVIAIGSLIASLGRLALAFNAVKIAAAFLVSPWGLAAGATVGVAALLSTLVGKGPGPVNTTSDAIKNLTRNTNALQLATHGFAGDGLKMDATMTKIIEGVRKVTPEIDTFGKKLSVADKQFLDLKATIQEKTSKAAAAFFNAEDVKVGQNLVALHADIKKLRLEGATISDKDVISLERQVRTAGFYLATVEKEKERREAIKKIREEGMEQGLKELDILEQQVEITARLAQARADIVATSRDALAQSNADTEAKLRELAKENELAKLRDIRNATVAEKIATENAKLAIELDYLQRSTAAEIAKVEATRDSQLAALTQTLVFADAITKALAAGQAAAIIANYQLIIDNLKKVAEAQAQVLKTTTGADVKVILKDADVKKATEAFRIVRRVTDDLSRSLADLIVYGGKFGDTMKRMAQEVAAEILRSLINGVLKKLAEQLGKMIPGLGKIFGVGGGATDVATGAADTVTKTTGAVAKSASSAIGSIASVVGAIGSVGSMIVGIFAARQQGKDMDVLIKHTLAILNVVSAMDYYIRGSLAGIHERLVQMVQWMTNGSVIPGGNGPGAPVLTGAGTTLNINISGGYFLTQSALDDFVTVLTNRMRQLGLWPS